MRLKIVLLPRKLDSRPTPFWDIGSVIANIRSECERIKLIDLETKNYYTKKYDGYLKNYGAVNVFRKESLCFVRSIIKDIGSIEFDVFHFYIDWWNETLPLAIAVAHQIKKLNKKARILLTGPYLNSYGKEISDKFKFIDYIAVSEIEPVFKNIFTDGLCASETSNIVYYNEKTRKVHETKRQVTDINDILFPEFDLFFSGTCPCPEVLPFRLSRGCKYRCFFCACLSAKRLRYYKDIDAVVSCLRKYKKIYNVRNFYFEDDALNFSNVYLETFLDKLIKARVNIQWSAY
ncbi:MAG: hypothetical protein KAR31_00575, partial [Candidatus Omnitrophica bacterium]|nr:hypothetical protein [Candidatus Omnitrophota bacterium]